MPDDLRTELEKAAKKRGRSLTDELLGRLRLSFAREREQERDRATRGICYLISQIAGPWVSVEEPWTHDPFKFRAFKLGVAKLLDALEPPGEARSPYDPAGPKLLLMAYETPESAGDHLATGTLNMLLQPRPVPDPDTLTRFADAVGLPEYFRARFIEALKQQTYGMSDARRDLALYGMSERDLALKGGKHGKHPQA
jgi:hypothetical protein